MTHASPAQPSPAQPIITPRVRNQVICVAGPGNPKFHCFISDRIPDIQLCFNGQVFPRYTFRRVERTG